MLRLYKESLKIIKLVLLKSKNTDKYKGSKFLYSIFITSG